MTPQLADSLRELKAKQWQEDVKVGKPIPQHIFNLTASIYRWALNKHLKAAELPRIRIHDLKHTYGIRLLKGHNINDVAFQLGHSDISITYKIYTHWIPGKFKSQVDELDTQPNATQAQPGEVLKFE